MKKNGFYIGLYATNCRHVLAPCTTTDFTAQKEEAKQFSNSTGVDMVYWFQHPAEILSMTDAQISNWVMDNGYLVYSTARDE